MGDGGPFATDAEPFIKDIRMNVAILIFPGIEVLDFSGPFEVFSIAARVALRDKDSTSPLFNAFLVAETSNVVPARYAFRVQPHYTFDDHPRIDLLVVPGGVIDQPLESLKTLEWISREARRSDMVASVCTGAFLLAKTGILDGLKATTHWEDVEDLKKQYPRIDVIEDQIFVDQGRVITSAGISAGIDMSLHLVRRLYGASLAQRAARQMVYSWRSTSV